ncbi:hypothetical protein BGZ61DRAFT_184852 [Ilyonectria robusta]|uniref:uncharacterized protein n=1 Tax=Ilyonectria robusta TaxID=1079257 RepID=UPI001E8CD69D|nr:uncharacterized protein BGZ61DRAFT_184852 [Ilyonectria robusta]KAH8729610.1 hypothetical protein BGZ61DRAFT_184852 [Ilyonectria robusta]
MKLPVRLQQLLALQAKIGRCHPTDRHSLAGCFESSRMNLGVLSGLLPGRIITNEKYHRVIMKRGGWYGNTRNKLLIWNLPWERKFIISVWDGALGSSGSTRAYRTVRVSLFFFGRTRGMECVDDPGIWACMSHPCCSVAERLAPGSEGEVDTRPQLRRRADT